MFATRHLNKWNLIWFLQTSYELPWDIDLELSGNYGTGALEGQIEVDWFAELDFSFGKKFLDDFSLKTHISELFCPLRQFEEGGPVRDFNVRDLSKFSHTHKVKNT